MSSLPAGETRPTPARLDPRLDREVEAVTSSPSFTGAASSARLLGLLAEEARAGREVSQHDLADALFGDAAATGRARSAVRELRRRLERHYAEDRPDAPLRLVIPRKQYGLELVPSGVRAERSAALEHAAVSLRRARPRWARGALGWAPAAVLGACALMLGVAGSNDPPEGTGLLRHVEWDGPVVTGHDDFGRTAWTRRLPSGLGEPPAPHDWRRSVVVTGAEAPQEVWLLPQPAVGAAARVLGWTVDGRPSKDVDLAAALAALGDPARGPLRPHAIVLLRDGDRRRLAVTACAPGDTCRALLLELDGSPVASHSHDGHLGAVLAWDPDGDGRDDLVLGGRSADGTEARLLVLDGRTLGAGAPRPAGTGRTIAGPAGQPAGGPPRVHVLRMPAPSRLEHGGPVLVESLAHAGRGLRLQVGIEEADWYVLLDEDLRPTVFFGDNYERRWDRLRRPGPEGRPALVPDEPLGPPHRDAAEAAIERSDGDGWRAARDG